MFKIAVLISGSGSNLQSIIDSIDSGTLNCQIEYVISDKAGAYGLERAKIKGIKTFVFDKSEYKENISTEILRVIAGKVDLIVLAGFMSIIKGNILKEFKNRIINIHPSLIPSFSGNGMYGLRVHKSAIAYGVKFSGCTVHFVDEGTDTGPIIIQKVVPVLEGDTAEELQKRVLVEEHKALPEAIKLICESKIQVQDRKVIFNGKGAN